MKHPLFILFALVALVSYAQPKEQLDTVYYDSNWKGCSPTFAAYYRVMTIPTDDNPRKQFRDYYITGEIQGEANYISIDREDDSKSIFDGEVVSYYKSGKTEKKSTWENGHQVGDAFSFYENGKVQLHTSLNEKGQPDGESSFFDEDGNLTAILMVHDGIPNTYLTAYNQMGSMGRYDVNTGAFVPEAVPVSSMKTKIVKGEKVYYYDDKNGIYLSIMVDAVKNYGKYYRIGISLFNNTNESIIFDPAQITANGRFFKKSKKKNNVGYDEIYADNDEANYTYNPSIVNTKDIRVWTYEDYAKKVHRRQQWDAALVALGEGLAAGSAGYSTSYSTSTTYGSAYGTGSGYASAYGSGGYAYGSYNSSASVYGSSTTTTTTRTYDATAAAIANERAAYNIATYSASLEADTQAINENYLQVTTLDPQTETAGYILLNKDKPNIIDLTIPVYGVAYHFHLTEIPK